MRAKAHLGSGAVRSARAWGGMLVLLAAALLRQTSATAEIVTIAFDFSRVSGDRDHHFGMHNPVGQFDHNGAVASFQTAASVLRATTTGNAWVVLDDEQPDTSNASMPTDGLGLQAGDKLVLRTRIVDLSSGDVGDAGLGGFLVGLNGNGNATADGFLAGVTRTPGGSGPGQLRMDSFANGSRAGNLALGSGFNYGGGGNLYFLELVLTPGSGGTDYALKLFADAAIPGSGNDLARLADPAFGSATPVSALTGTLAGYDQGWVGLYFEDMGGGGNNGGVSFGNFYVQIIPEPASGLLLALAGMASLRGRRPWQPRA